MTTQPIVSVVIPVYNAEPYLRACLNSVVNQTLREIEIICVDDGSTDGSLAILREYEAADKRVKVLTQQNLYAGVARNNGMAAACGEYVIFLDSDDFFEPDMLKAALLCAQKNRAEIVIFGYNKFDMQTGIKEPQQIKLPGHVFSADELGIDFINTIQTSAWNKLYLRSFIEDNGLQFEARKKCNDSYFVQLSVILASRMVYLNRRLVNYRVNNPNSLQGKKNESRESYIDCRIHIKKSAAERGKYHGTVKAALIHNAIQILKSAASAPISFPEYKQYYDSIKPRLIPCLFDDEQDFKHDAYVTNLYHSRDFGEFLLLQLHAAEEALKSDYISKKSYDYRVGHALMGLPRRIMRLFDETERRKPK